MSSPVLIDTDIDVATFDCSSETLIDHVEISGPGDKSISHRAVLMGALAEGATLINGLSCGLDVAATMCAITTLGAQVEELGSSNDGVNIKVVGAGRSLGAVSRDEITTLDFGNSGTGIRLAMGVVVGIEGKEFRLVGDKSLSTRPMDRVISPLRAFGAQIEGVGDRATPPIKVSGTRLDTARVATNVASAQVKSALLLAALWAPNSPDSASVITEDVATRAHTEEMLIGFGADIVVSRDGDRTHITVGSSLPLRPTTVDVARDPSQIAFWIVAALLSGFELTTRNLYVGQGRLGLVDVLRNLGAAVSLSGVDQTTSGPTATLTVDGTKGLSAIGSVDIAASEVSSMVDEIPVLSLLLARIDGVHRLRGLGELRIKETDRVESTAALLRALGRQVAIVGDDLIVHGDSQPFAQGTVTSDGDHRIAMCAAIAALSANGPIAVEGWQCVATSYPDFEKDWQLCVS